MKKFMVVIMSLWVLVACASQPQEVEIPVAQVTIPVERATDTAVSTHTAVPATATPSPTTTATPLPTQTAAPTLTPTATYTPTPTHPLAALPYRIVFSSDREDNNGDIFTMQADGSDWQRLTDDPAFDFAPMVSPDGQQIAFASDRGGGNLQIYVMDADGSNVTQLTDHSGNDRDPSWSPDGSQIVFASDRNGNPDIFVMNRDGSNVIQLTDNTETDVSPAWSPDGEWIVFSSGDEGDPNLYVMRPDGSSMRRLTFSPNYDGDQAAWSPDSQWIIFPSSRIGNYELYGMSLDGTIFGTVTRTERDEYSGLLSPDGRYLLINIYDQEFIGLVVRDLQTGEEFALTDSSYRASYAAWVPAETAVYDPLFLAAASKPDEACVYAEDDTYGYTAENPIPNGNGPQFGGPFDGLFVYNLVRVTPGESQTSVRQHTFPTNAQDDYLDTYLFASSGGESVVLYANINDYDIPQIPVGMFCDLALP